MKNITQENFIQNSKYSNPIIIKLQFKKFIIKNVKKYHQSRISHKVFYFFCQKDNKSTLQCVHKCYSLFGMIFRGNFCLRRQKSTS